MDMLSGSRLTPLLLLAIDRSTDIRLGQVFLQFGQLHLGVGQLLVQLGHLLLRLGQLLVKLGHIRLRLGQFLVQLGQLLLRLQQFRLRLELLRHQRLLREQLFLQLDNSCVWL